MCRFIQCGTEQMAFLKYRAKVVGDRWGEGRHAQLMESFQSLLSTLKFIL